MVIMVINNISTIALRLDERDSSGGCFRWLLLSWSPDQANTRQKMLYASTKATFKKEFGQSQIKEEIFANMRDDVCICICICI